jgi:glucose/arabinose dehydrogenase
LPATAAGAAVYRERTSAGEIAVETIAGGLEHPWGLAFLPDGAMLVTERSGQLRRITPEGAVSAPLGGVPAVASGGQGGLLDVALDPQFSSNRMVYLTYSEPRGGGLNGTSVLRGRLDAAAGAIEAPTVIFRQQPGFAGTNHFGSRLAFAPDGTLFVTLGERYSLRDKAQDLSTHLGKVVRLNPDGSVPKDNPFVGQPARAEI